MADNVIVRYIGPLDVKKIPWLPTRPIFNKATGGTVELSEESAGKLVSRCSDIFEIVGPAKAPPLDPEKLPDGVFGTKVGNGFKTAVTARMQIPRICKTYNLKAEYFNTEEYENGWFLVYTGVVKEEEEIEEMEISEETPEDPENDQPESEKIESLGEAIEMDSNDAEEGI